MVKLGPTPAWYHTDGGKCGVLVEKGCARWHTATAPVKKVDEMVFEAGTIWIDSGGGTREFPGDTVAVAAEEVPELKVGGYEPPPTHYATTAGMDPWAVWDAFNLDRYTANAVKYLLRAGKKDIAPRLDDLRKAANYIAKAIEMEERKT